MRGVHGEVTQSIPNISLWIRSLVRSTALCMDYGEMDGLKIFGIVKQLLRGDGSEAGQTEKLVLR
jgi:hypothetical protein